MGWTRDWTAENIQLPGVASVRGIDVDNDGVISGYRLDRWPPRSLRSVSGQSSLFSIPTEGAMPYSVFVDRNRATSGRPIMQGTILFVWILRAENSWNIPLQTTNRTRASSRSMTMAVYGFAEWWNNRAGLLDPGY
ncbi:hypothetical protein [Sphingopyxis sp.]|uniref:hypothetical protein n=1 Tax=Sphingopyxis sp. TaxID=1908224 RepID=UPI0025CCB451|nr:hypothetical protein [Sphingopyxis sp.]MBK6413227.1 hypothetical protein [Sphingopyxis sp.]